MVFLEYEYQNSFFHTLTPATKFIVMLTFTFLTSFWLDPMLVIFLLIMVILVSRLANLPRSWYAVALITMIGVLVGQARTMTPIFYATSGFFRKYPPEITQIMILPLTPSGTPIFGETAITVGVLLYVTSTCLMQPIGVIALMTFMYSTSLSDMLSELETLGFPDAFNFMFMVAWRFLPEMERMLIDLIAAQRLRGLRTKTRNPMKLLGVYGPLAYPIASYMVTQTDRVAISIKSRAFGTKRRTRAKGIIRSRNDYGVMAVCVSLSTVALALYRLYGIGLI